MREIKLSLEATELEKWMLGKPKDIDRTKKNMIWYLNNNGRGKTARDAFYFVAQGPLSAIKLNDRKDKEISDELFDYLQWLGHSVTRITAKGEKDPNDIKSWFGGEYITKEEEQKGYSIILNFDIIKDDIAGRTFEDYDNAVRYARTNDCDEIEAVLVKKSNNGLEDIVYTIAWRNI